VSDDKKYSYADVLRDEGKFFREFERRVALPVARAMFQALDKAWSVSADHDAVPEAKASPSESSVSLGNGGGCGGIDNPVTLPAMGTGDIPVSRTQGRVGTILSEAEIDAIECVVEDGRIASMSIYGVMRSLLVRLRPEWESESYEKSDEKRTNTNTNRDTTPREGSVQGEGTLTAEEREAIEIAIDSTTVCIPPIKSRLRTLLERLT
jgi:hypothetical protein